MIIKRELRIAAEIMLAFARCSRTRQSLVFSVQSGQSLATSATMNSGSISKPILSLSNAARAVRELYPVLLLLLIASLGSTSALAHEHTLPGYAASLRQAEAEHGIDDQSSEAGESADGSVCRLTLNLVDSETKRPLSGLVRLKTSQGDVLPLEGLLNRGTGLRRSHRARQWHVVIDSATVCVPRKQLTIEALSGLETELLRKTIDLTGKATSQVTLPLAQFHRAAAHGWHNGNTHLHLMSLTRDEADRYLRSISRADGLEVVFVSFLRRVTAERNYVSNSYTKRDLQKLSGHGVMFDHGEELRHNFGPGGEGYGHVMFLDIDKLIRPVSIGPGIMGEGYDFPSLRSGIDQARGDGATVVWCHNAFGMQDIPEWIAGTLDAHNIFDGGTRGSYEDTYYRFMNIGLRVPFSTGTDWFIFDFSRAYVEVQEPLNVDRWLEALEAGRSFITNGPFLQLQVDGHRPGDVIRLTQPAQLAIRGRVVGRNDFQKIEVIHNGNVIATKSSSPVGGHFEAELTCPFDANESGWIALRVNSEQKNELGGSLFGHTSAVYIELAGKSIFKADAARELISDMQESIQTTQEKAVFADGEQRERVLDIYRDGIATLRKRLSQE